MSRMERKFEIDSILINKNFLEELIKIIDDNINLKGEGIKTEIIIKSEQETFTFENLKDLIDCLILPKKIKSISIDKYPVYHVKDNIIKFPPSQPLKFFLNIKDSDNSYYRLIGYDDGKLSTCQKQLSNLFDKYKNWYSFLYKLPFPEGTIPLLMGISLVIFLWKFLPDLPYTEEYRETYNVIVLGIGGVFWYIFHKCYNFLFPFFDFQINRTERSNWWRGFIGLISIGLLVNLIWKLIQLIFSKVP